MGYAKQIYKQAAAELKARREQAQATAALHKKQFAEKCPAVLDIEAEMAKTGLEAVKAVGAGENALEIVQNLAKYNLELQKKRKELLTENGFAEDFLLPKYTCSICEDTGVQNGEPCTCYQSLLKTLAYKELAAETPLKLCDFDSFSLSRYSDKADANGTVVREEMREILSRCKTYAQEFSPASESLFFVGRTGLGKTHLSLAIAQTVIQKGYGVVYGTAQNLLSKLEKERFGQAENQDTESLLLDCDLLILDDLGTEYTTNYIVSAVYNIINTRMLRGRATIINTNLPITQLEKKYTDRVVSRILGNYTVFHFQGNDLRIPTWE